MIREKCDKKEAEGGGGDKLANGRGGRGISQGPKAHLDDADEKCDPSGLEAPLGQGPARGATVARGTIDQEASDSRIREVSSVVSSKSSSPGERSRRVERVLRDGHGNILASSSSFSSSSSSYETDDDDDDDEDNGDGEGIVYEAEENNHDDNVESGKAKDNESSRPRVDAQA